MSSQQAGRDSGKESEQRENREPDGGPMALKLSRELSNWRRRRNEARPARPDGSGESRQPVPARTIRVRGHETLVVRKPKLAVKPQPDPRPATNE